MKGHGRVPSGCRAMGEESKDAALAAEGMPADEIAFPQALKPTLLQLPADGAAKAGPFQNCKSAQPSVITLVRMGVVCVVLAMLPFALWTARNWRVFHVFEPLAPRYATDPGEPTDPGWQRWTKTWCLDFVSTYDIYWSVPGVALDLTKLPSRAFDSPAQFAETAALFDAYNQNGQELSAEIDAGFARLAEERVQGASAALLRLAAAGTHGGYGSAASSREPEHRPGLVGRKPPLRGDALQLGLRGAECGLSAAGAGGALLTAAVLAVDGALLRAAQPAADDDRSARGALHTGVFSHGVCAGRDRDLRGLRENSPDVSEAV